MLEQRDGRLASLYHYWRWEFAHVHKFSCIELKHIHFWRHVLPATVQSSFGLVRAHSPAEKPTSSSGVSKRKYPRQQSHCRVKDRFAWRGCAAWRSALRQANPVPCRMHNVSVDMRVGSIHGSLSLPSIAETPIGLILSVLPHKVKGAIGSVGKLDQKHSPRGRVPTSSDPLTDRKAGTSCTRLYDPGSSG
jgi:hypothetical protein